MTEKKKKAYHYYKEMEANYPIWWTEQESLTKELGKAPKKIPNKKPVGYKKKTYAVGVAVPDKASKKVTQKKIVKKNTGGMATTWKNILIDDSISMTSTTGWYAPTPKKLTPAQKKAHLKELKEAEKAQKKQQEHYVQYHKKIKKARKKIKLPKLKYSDFKDLPAPRISNTKNAERIGRTDLGMLARIEKVEI